MNLVEIEYIWPSKDFLATKSEQDVQSSWETK